MPRFAPIRSGLNEDHLFLFLALLIGVFAGLAVVCFRVSIEWSRLALLGASLEPPFPRIVLVPALAGLVVGAVVLFVMPAARGSGVHQTKAAVYVYDGLIPFRTVLTKFATCAVAIGGGHALGPEDPSLQIGAGLASLFGRALHLSRDKLRLVAPIGAAAGLAAAFNSPITAVLFVVEEVVGTWRSGVLGAIVVAAVSAVVVEQWFLGGDPLFRVPAYTLEHPSELVAYAALGVAGGFAALVFTKLVLFLRPRLRKATTPWRLAQPLAAGALIGLLGMWWPQVMGAGYEYMDEAMHDQYGWPLLAALAAAKILATSLSFSTGVPGGLFAPTLFIGAMLGGAVCGIERVLVPGLAGPIGAYALVGMGVLFAGILRAPMTSVFMMVEVSGNYSIVLPVMIANGIAYAISRRFQPVPIFEVLSQQDGVHLPSMEEERDQRPPRVEDAMRGAPPILSPGESVASARARLDGAPHALVALAGAWSIVSAADLERVVGEGRGAETVAGTVEYARVPTVHRDQPLDIALRLIGDRALLPVVHRADPSKLEGVLTLEAILDGYRRRPMGSG